MARGIEHHSAGRLTQAVDCYSRAVAMVPQHGEAWRLLGVVALQSGDSAAARHLLERAIRIDPNDALSHSALGSVDECEGRLELACAEYAAAWEIDAAHEPTVIGLTRVALKLGRTTLAIGVAEAGRARGMVDPRLLRALGAGRIKMGDYDGGIEALQASLHVSAHPDAFANLGAAYMHLQRVDEAIAACEGALALEPLHADATNVLGSARAVQSSFAVAAELFQRAMALGSEEAPVNLGTMRLLTGDYRGGWPYFAWVNAERRANLPFASLPMWDGTPAPEQRLLIWPEQGIGDTIQMVRFLRRARTLVGSISLACPPGTLDLFRSLEGVDRLIDLEEHPHLDSADLWLPTVRLPLIFDATPDSIPATPYLHADPLRIEHFRSKLEGPKRLRVGLVWSGNPSHQRDAFRSCGLRALEPLNDVADVTWIALQQGAGRPEQPQNGMQLVPINAEVSDFADTAAILAQLDVIITVDTSVAHLAGGLGRPAWVLIPKRPDWRWQLAGDSSPWYPTLRLFRQGDDGTWEPVVAAIAGALRELVTAEKARSSAS